VGRWRTFRSGRNSLKNENPDRSKVLVLAPHYLPASQGGGPIQTVAAMVENHSSKHRFYIITADTDWRCSEPMDVPSAKWTSVGEAEVLYLPRGLASFLMAAREIRKINPGFLYLNSTLNIVFSVVPLLARKIILPSGATTILAPRGELGAGALNQKRTKKTLFLAVAKLIGLHRGLTWHASSVGEKAEIVKHYPHAAVIVRSNETRLPTSATVSSGPVANEVAQFVYVGRVSPKKGLDLLMEAMALINEPMSLSVYGPADSDEYLSILQTKASSLRFGVDVHFLGPVPHDRVAEIFSGADAFIFPTAHENFGHVIAESMSVGCPVIMMGVSPFSDYIRNGGGTIVANCSPDEWASEILRWINMTNLDRQQKRNQTARQYDTWRASQELPSVFQLYLREGLDGDRNSN